MFVVVEEDAYQRLPVRERYQIGVDRGPPRHKSHDLLIISWRMLAEDYLGSSWDLHHHMFRFAQTLHDPSGRIAPLIARLAALPPEVREARMRVHYFEALWTRYKASRCVERGLEANARLLAFSSLPPVVKLLFVAAGSWAANKNWALEELGAEGIPTEIIGALAAALADPRLDVLKRMMELIDAWLEQQGVAFHRTPPALIEWATFSDEGIAAMRRWSTTYG